MGSRNATKKASATGSGAEHGRQHDVAGKAGQPRQQGQAADGEDTADHQRGPCMGWGASERRVAPSGYRSARQRLPGRGDDPILGRLVDIGVHRQADHFLGQALADRHAALDDGEMPVGFLAIAAGSDNRPRSECPAP